ncbi:MAG: NADH-quinone oxidoreductase subunit N, partial [Kouleothrix sp.]
MLLALALLVLGTDVLERWGTDPESQRERGKAAGQLTAIGLGFVFVVALVQSKFLFTIPAPTADTNPILAYLLTLGGNLQAGGPGGAPILGAFA